MTKENIYANATTPGYRHHLIVPMLQQHEGKELHLPMVVLTTREEREVEVRAYRDTRTEFGDIKIDEDSFSFQKVLSNNTAVYTIYFAARIPGDLIKKWFQDKQQVEDTYTPEEAGIITNNYMTVKLSQPHLKSFNQEDPNAFQGMIDNIKKSGEGDFFLNGYTTHSVNQLVKFLVVQLEKSQTNNGSSGTP